MPQIPPIPIWDPDSKKKFDFAESIYLAMTLFMPEDTVEALEKHYLVNKKALAVYSFHVRWNGSKFRRLRSLR